MCGIFGYTGNRHNGVNAFSVCLEGLKNLEYRGYDSSGIATIDNNSIQVVKTAGKVALLEELLKQRSTTSIAIGHTRWATHGKPSASNAHPHIDTDNHIALVHNGIIDNYLEIKNKLISQEVSFTTDTDTEVICKLIAYHYQGSPLDALKEAIKELKGSFAIAFIHKDFPEKIFSTCKESPLVLGFDKKNSQAFLSSDSNALRSFGVSISFLHCDEIAILEPCGIKILDLEGKVVSKELHTIDNNLSKLDKGDFEHFMLKEIHEQPESIQRALQNRLDENLGVIKFDELDLFKENLRETKRVLILGCGSSYHAGLIAKQYFEDLARIPTDVEIASEFRYSNPIISENTLVIAISQSGETADTLAAVREAKTKGAFVIALCNVQYSSLERLCDKTLFLKAGVEISVCSTKAFSSQLILLLQLAIFLGRLNELSKIECQKLIGDLKKLPTQIQNLLSNAKPIQDIAKEYANFQHFFFLGRRYMFPAALEASLKLKEISYVYSIAYPSGEMKHGPIALVDENLVSIILGGNEQTFEKLKSNLEEIKARNGKIVALIPSSKQVDSLKADHVIVLEKVSDYLAPILYSVASQLFAYYVALANEKEIDQPRNLAKSVTVE